MEISKADQIALDDALVAPANRLKIGKCNLRLISDVTSKDATLQVVYDVLKLTPFYKAFQVSADVPEIYMQEFWASAYIHNRSVRFKMNNKSTFSILINSETYFKFALKSVQYPHDLMKGTCKSLTELEYFCEEVYKATTKKLDWINPEGRQYPHDLRKPLSLVLNSQGRHVI
ncbi:hypothetical protein Tco_1526848, partial [Tanacetum coccineum]